MAGGEDTHSIRMQIISSRFMLLCIHWCFAGQYGVVSFTGIGELLESPYVIVPACIFVLPVLHYFHMISNKGCYHSSSYW